MRTITAAALAAAALTLAACTTADPERAEFEQFVAESYDAPAPSEVGGYTGTQAYEYELYMLYLTTLTPAELDHVCAATPADALTTILEDDADQADPHVFEAVRTLWCDTTP